MVTPGAARDQNTVSMLAPVASSLELSFWVLLSLYTFSEATSYLETAKAIQINGNGLE